MFPKVYVCSKEGIALHVACCIVQAELKVHAEEREEEHGSAIESEGKEELMKKGKQGLCNATHVRQSPCAVFVKRIHNLL